MKTPEAWDAQRVDLNLALYPLVARMRFSKIAGVAQVDVYAWGSIPDDINSALRAHGWWWAGTHHGLWYGAAGRFYRHHAITPQRVRRTRELLLQFLEDFYPTEYGDAMMQDFYDYMTGIDAQP